MIGSQIPYRGSLSLSASWNILETISTTNILDNSVFMLDITIQSGNGNSIVECCSFIRCFSTYKISAGVITRVSYEVQIRRANSSGGANSIELIDGVDYQEVINGSNEIEIQIDKSTYVNTDASWSILLDCIES